MQAFPFQAPQKVLNVNKKINQEDDCNISKTSYTFSFLKMFVAWSLSLFLEVSLDFLTSFEKNAEKILLSSRKVSKLIKVDDLIRSVLLCHTIALLHVIIPKTQLHPHHHLDVMKSLSL